MLPSSSALSICSAPPISSTKRLQMDRPRPLPPKRRVVDASACEKPSKIWTRFSAAMPMPLSRTAMRNCMCWAVCSSTLNCTTTSPRLVNLMALPPRLISTCCSRMASPTMTGGMRGSTSNSTSIGLGPTLADKITDRSRSSRSMRKGCGSSAILPASILEKSSTSLSRPNRDLAAPSALVA